MYKVYFDGLDFIKENESIINENPEANSFILLNAKEIVDFKPNSYILKLYDEKSYLFIVYPGHHNVSISGDAKFAAEAAKIIWDYNLDFKSIIGDGLSATRLAEEYIKLAGGEYNCSLNMDIMKCNNKVLTKAQSVKFTEVDIRELTVLYISFVSETLHQAIDDQTATNFITKNLNQFRGIVLNNEIVSIARRSRESNGYAFISVVYTKPEYRGIGLSYEVVGDLVNEIIDSNKTACLYVDRTNPISNHLYSKIGFSYDVNHKELQIKPLYLNAVFAGGCFWCMSKPYYEYEGVTKVISGYAGGHVYDPDYKMVKTGDTGHKEVVRIIYDPNIISYKDLLTIYFENIDPFDSDGQFIDRGDNYTTAVFSSNSYEKIVYDDIVAKIEDKYKKKVEVRFVPNAVFYMAEDYHQDYALKNKEAFENEEKISKRTEFEYIKVEE